MWVPELVDLQWRPDTRARLLDVILTNHQKSWTIDINRQTRNKQLNNRTKECPEKSSLCLALTTNFSMGKHQRDGTQIFHRVTNWRYLPEAAHPYYVLKKNGYDVVFASPKGS